MKRSALSWLACPDCGGAFDLTDAHPAGDEIETGTLLCTVCKAPFPIERAVPRFVPAQNYAANFGFQWNKFRRTQLDSYSGTTITRDRFVGATGWTAADLAGKRVLDVGCGAGRFAEVALSLGAEVTALDYSSAVDACWANLGPHPRLDVVQGDIYRLPLRHDAFDFVYCLGVLQHTPDVGASFRALLAPLRPGGRLTVDVYYKRLRSMMTPKYVLRPFTRRVPQQQLFAIIERSVPSLMAVSRSLRAVPVVGRYLSRVVPVADYAGRLPLNEQQLYEWAVLDTFDQYGPRYDQPQSAATVKRWLREARLTDVEVLHAGHLVGRGRKPLP